MTVPIELEAKCSICGKMSKQWALASTSAFGSPDLDLRAPEPARSSMRMWIQVCPHCGYAAPDISESIPGAEEVVRSNKYQELIKESELPGLEFPKLENAFICYSLIQENAKDYVEAGWAQVHAAWVCDDKNLKNEAKKHRLEAVELFKKAKENGKNFAEDEMSEYALLIDLLRRSEKFEEAMGVLNEALNKNPEGFILKVLQYQKVLIEKRDSDVHTLDEAKSTIQD